MKRISADHVLQVHMNVLLSSFLILGILFSPAFDLLHRIPHVCIFQKYLGIPCPACGLLTSCHCLRELRFADALRANPAGILIVASLFIQIFLRTWAIIAEGPYLTVVRISKITTILIVTVLMIQWLFHLLILH
jgi:hypothetical protein